MKITAISAALRKAVFTENHLADRTNLNYPCPSANCKPMVVLDMCGIAGIVDFDGALEAAPHEIDAMTGTMACRGPDSDGTWISRHVALGHRRLAIIDIEHGLQPMTVESGHLGQRMPITIVFSGEVYNYAELRNDLLARGHKFLTRSDTEVVLVAYLEWGEELVEKLAGMYAFAVWDSRTESLLLVRDRMGVKPLFYAVSKKTIVFGSEPKALFAHSTVSPAVNLDSLREALTSARGEGWGFWNDVHEIAPGSLAKFSRDGLSKKTYWRIETVPHTDSVETTCDKIRYMLEGIVGEQLVADVSRGLLLSGGLDSSALAAISAKNLARHGESVHSFSVGFTEEMYADDMHSAQADGSREESDAPYARSMADFLGAKHTEILLSARDMADPGLWRAVIAANDAPIGGEMFSSLYLLSAAVREYCPVVLSGESADELFGGYRWFFVPKLQSIEMFPWLVGPLSARSMLRDSLLTALDLKSYAADAYHDAIGAIDRLDGESEFEWRMRKMCYLALTRYLRIALHRKDRMSMAAGLEVRVPFADHRLVQYVFNTPWWMKTHDGREKSLLRSAVKDLLPTAISYRKKCPYPGIRSAEYVRLLSMQVSHLAAQGHKVFELIDRRKVDSITVSREGGTSNEDHGRLEVVLMIANWIDVYNPVLNLP
jgi:asparagine synthase (glutamine-hydrolysing)